MGATIGSIQINSQALSRTVTYTVILPDPAEVNMAPPYPVLLQLHGRHDDHTSWLYKSQLLEYVKNIPLIIVMPSGENGFWCNLTSQNRYEDFVVQDLRQHVENLFNTTKDRPWAIGGLSMGGYGALRLGLKHPDKFCSIFAHSSVIPSRKNLVEVWTQNLGINAGQAEDLDCYYWAEKTFIASNPIGQKTVQPVLSFDCGVDDSLIQDNRNFHSRLDEMGFKHTYNEYKGGHTWDYWNKHIQKALIQHSTVFGIAAPEINTL